MRTTVFGAAGNVGSRVVAEGSLTISLEDLAVALPDEAERPRHHRTRFTAAY